VKICPKCGVSQKDSNRLCIDCGAPLGKPIDEEAAYQIEKSRREKIDGLSYNLDELSMGRLKLPLICVFIACIVGSIVLILLSAYKVIPFTEQHFLLAPIIFSAVGIYLTAFPEISWKLELWRLSWYIDTSDASPSFGYILGHKIAVWCTLILVVGGIVSFFWAGEVVPDDDWMPGIYVGDEKIDGYYRTSDGAVYYIN